MPTQPYSLAYLVRKLKAPMCFCSGPEMGSRCPPEPGKFDVKVMEALEYLQLSLDPEFDFIFGVDYAGSSSGDFCGSRIRHIGDDKTYTGAGDFMGGSKTYREELSRPPLPACSEEMRQNIENSFWICFWRGQVSGTISSCFSMAPKIDDPSVPGDFDDINFFTVSGELRAVVVITIDGGPITQVEKAMMPSILSSVNTNMNRRGCGKDKYSTNTFIVWCHFPNLEELVLSMDGVKNLVADDADMVQFSNGGFEQTKPSNGRTFRSLGPSGQKDDAVPSLFQDGATVQSVMRPKDINLEDKFNTATSLDDQDTLLFLVKKYAPDHMDEILPCLQHPAESWSEGVMDAIVALGVEVKGA